MSRSAQSPRSRWRFGGKGTRKKILVGVAAVTMSLLTACSAGTAGGGGNAGGGGGNGGGGKEASRYINLSPCCSWHPTWSNNRYNVDGLGILDDWVKMRLAIRKAPSLTDFEPQLAEKWAATDGKLTVTLRKGVNWEDGKPTTAKDVVTTSYLNALRGDGFWNDISSVKAVDDQTVEYTLRPGQDPQLAQLDILPNIIPDQDGTFPGILTDGLKKDIETYYAAKQKSPESDAPGKMPEFKRMGDAFTKLAALKVDKVVGNGPFKLDNVTTQQAKLTKSTTFWNKDKIKVAGINYFNSNNETIYPQLFSDGADFSNVYLSPPTLKKWQSTPGAKTALPQAFGFVLGFNSKRPNLNVKEVRQALAYVIDRQKMSEAAYGTTKEAGGAAKDVPTGMSPTLDKLFLSSDQLGKLQPYKPDAAKATQLLTSKGYKKQGNQWLQPDGKAFTLSMTVNSETTDIVTSFNSAAQALTAFGIKTEVKATNGAQQDADQHNGNFDMGMMFVGGSNPLAQFNSLLGPGYNYTSQGNYAGKTGIGFGPKMEVPGIGNVDVPSTISKQVNSVPPNDKMKEAAWSWAQLVNDQVPYIWYATKVYQFSYSDKHYSNWPPMDANGSSPLWDIIADNMNGGLSLAMQQGYIVPK